MGELPNLKYLDELAGDDLIFRKEFIAVLKKEFPQEKLEYEDNFARKEYVKASENVHKLKHKLNVLALHESHSVAVRHEFELRNNTSSLSEEFASVLSLVESYLKTI